MEGYGLLWLFYSCKLSKRQNFVSLLAVISFDNSFVTQSFKTVSIVTGYFVLLFQKSKKKKQRSVSADERQ